MLHAVLGVIAVPLALFAQARGEQLARRSRAILYLLLGTLALGFLAANLRAVAATIAKPPEWDFHWFWIFGRVADLGQNFYDPRFANAIADSLREPRDLYPELFFWYPPPTMFLFAPLGLLKLQPALILWSAFNLGALAAGIVVVYRMFFRSAGALGALVAATLVLAWGSVEATLYVAQTNFLLLLAILAYWSQRS
ncbi:MAG: glycosyltransferase family 87 protein, partial [Vulcanimicrobiaceae bacterium]